MKGLQGNPIPLAVIMLWLGPSYLWWPQSSGPALFCGLPLLLLLLANKVQENSRRLDRLERSQRLIPTSHSPQHPGGAPSDAGS